MGKFYVRTPNELLGSNALRLTLLTYGIGAGRSYDDNDDD
jgi:hypothetical protein